MKILLGASVSTTCQISWLSTVTKHTLVPCRHAAHRSYSAWKCREPEYQHISGQAFIGRLRSGDFYLSTRDTECTQCTHCILWTVKLPSKCVTAAYVHKQTNHMYKIFGPSSIWPSVYSTSFVLLRLMQANTPPRLFVLGSLIQLGVASMTKKPIIIIMNYSHINVWCSAPQASPCSRDWSFFSNIGIIRGLCSWPSPGNVLW